MREREFAVLDIPENPPTPAPADASTVLAPGAKIEKLEDGFFSISGAAVDASGKLYFVDHHQQRIYGWSAAEGLTIERDNPLDPVNLAFDKAGDLIVVSSAGPEGTVYSFRPGSPEDQITILRAAGCLPSSGARPHFCRSTTGTMANSRDQLDFNTLTYKTLAGNVCAKMCRLRRPGNTSRPMAACFCPQVVSFSRARRTSRAGVSPTISTLMASSALCPASAFCQQRIGRPHLQRARRCRRHAERSASLLRSAAAKASRSIAEAMSTSRTARSSSTTPRAN